jgi:hypothetical protein
MINTNPPRSCEALGTCQHAEQECPGACRQIPHLVVAQADDAPYAAVGGFELAMFWAALLIVLLITVTPVGVATGYLWFQLGDTVEQLFWSVMTRWF